jgi:hypothetical protein
MTLTSLYKGTVSPGSACLIAAVPEEWVDSIPAVDPLTGRINDDIILKAGKKWLRVVLVSRTRFFTEESNLQPAGLLWQQSVTGRSAGQNGSLHILLEQWASHRWVILYKEVGTSATYLIGKPGSGALMNLKYSNDKATVSTIGFNRLSVKRAFIYAGSYTLDNDVVMVGDPGDSYETIRELSSIFYRASGAEGVTINFPSLVGKDIIYISRSGAKDLEVITDPDEPIDLDTKCYFNKTTGDITVAADWPYFINETVFILYK